MVPSLDNLAQAEAENLLVEKESRSTRKAAICGVRVETGRVIPHSQSPGYGLAVRPGTAVTFAISVHEEREQQIGSQATHASVSLFRPKSGQKARCHKDGDNVFRFEVTGTAFGLSERYGLLLWVRPVNPPSETPVWDLQRLPVNGISSIRGDGSWVGTGQIGNAMWPPHEGDLIDLAVSVADTQTITSLMSEPGVIVRSQPVGTSVEIASSVVITVR